MNVLANDNELLKHIKIWNKIQSLFNEIGHNKKGFQSKTTYNNEYIRAKINSYDEHFHGNKRLKNMNIMDILYYY